MVKRASRNYRLSRIIHRINKDNMVDIVFLKNEVFLLVKIFIVTVILVLLVALKMTRKRTRHELLATIQ